MNEKFTWVDAGRKSIALASCLGLFAMSAVFVTPAQADPKCTHRAVINTQGNKPSSVNPDEIRARTGDSVCWKVAGKPHADFYITYPSSSPTNSPSKSNGGWVVHVISVSHTGNSEKDTYKYDVVIPGGGKLDPKIIIDP